MSNFSLELENNTPSTATSYDLPEVQEVRKAVEQEFVSSPEETKVIENAVAEKAKTILDVNMDSLAERKGITSVIEMFGSEIVQRSETKNNILAKRLTTLGENGNESGEVAKGLEYLTIKMRDLDPSGLDFVKSGFMGKFFNPVRRYFERYKTADQEIAEIVKSLDKGKNVLKNDNTTLEIEALNMRNLTKDLTQKIEIGTQLDAYLSSAIENKKIEGVDEEKVKFVEEEVLFPLRQKLMDFQQLLAVNQQGIIAMEVIRKNNMELIRAVDRAKSVTIASLRTAVTVAGALYNQRIVLEKVSLLNETTNNMIAATSRMLKEQGVSIQKQAVEANISPDTLKQAFADTLSALDDISNYKTKALPMMAKTISDFQMIAEEGEKQIQRMEKAGAFDGH